MVLSRLTGPARQAGRKTVFNHNLWEDEKMTAKKSENQMTLTRRGAIKGIAAATTVTATATS